MGHPAGPVPVILSELAAAVVTQRQRLASAFEIVNSLAGMLDDEFGIMVGDELRAVIDENGILRFLSPVPLVGPCVDPASPPSLSVPLPLPIRRRGVRVDSSCTVGGRSDSRARGCCVFREINC